MDASQPSNTASLRIYLLGEFRLVVDSRTIDDDQWKLRKAKSLVKLLALAPHHHLHREQVIDLLWPERNFSAAANNLHQTLYIARRIVDPEGARANQYLAWHEDFLSLGLNNQVWIDIEAFEAAAHEARRSQDTATYQSALDLYRGELLPEDRYDDWAAARREALRQLYLSLLAELANLYEARQQYTRAIEPLQRLLATEPAHEEAHCSLMRQYALSADRPHALRQYQVLRDTLRAELDVEPDAVSRRLYEQILAGRIDPPEPRAVVRPNNLPLPATSFIGRESEKAEVKRLLKSTRLLTLTGPGGCGKTRLALEIARPIQDEFADGIWLVELAALADPALVPQAVASALGLADLTSQSATELITHYLRPKQLLLILDNCEHLLDASAQLTAALLRACPSLRVLATSRESLRVAGELSWRVPSLSLPDLQTLLPTQDFLQYEAIRLFVERARAVAPGFNLTERNAPALAKVCHRLDGIPLGLELAAARITALSIDQIAERLDDRFRLLASGSRTAPTRQQTLQATIDWSYVLLSPQERTLFQRLSVFTGGWTLEAAEVVCAADDLQSREVLDVLSSLIGKSCVAVEQRDDSPAVRYSMLETLRQYAATKLVQADETRAVKRKHALYVLALAAEAEPHINGAERDSWLDGLERDHDNLRTAFAGLIAAGETELALSLVGSLYSYWDRRGHLSEGLRWVQKALPMSSTLEPTVARAKALLSAGKIHWLLSDYPAARAALGESVTLFRRFGDKQNLARALMHLGYTFHEPSEMPVKRPIHDESLALFQEVGDAYGVAELFMGLGTTARIAGDFATAHTHYDKSLILFQKLEDRWGLAAVLRNLARLATAEGNHSTACSFYERGLVLFRAQGIRLDIALTLRELGDVWQKQGDIERAASCYREGLTESSNLGLLRDAIGYLIGLVEVALSRALWEHTAKLCAAVSAICDKKDIELGLVLHARLKRSLATVQSQLDEAALAAALAEGHTLTADEAIREALLV